MHRHAAKDGVELLDLHAIRGILLVLRCDVTRSSGFARFFVLGALQDYLDAIASLSHGSMRLFGRKSVRTSIGQYGIDSLLIHGF